VNERKEFFRVGIDEIAVAVRRHHGEIEITRAAEAIEYRKSLAMSRGIPSVPDVEGFIEPGTHVLSETAQAV
jgi:hypothetical protein